jgi:CheY-like chemotaxis protein
MRKAILLIAGASPMVKILSVGPDHDVLAARNRELRDCGYHVHSAETRSDTLDLARSGIFEIILICDQFLPAYAARLADEIHNVAPRTTILLLARYSPSLSAGEIHFLIDTQARQHDYGYNN